MKRIRTCGDQCHNAKGDPKSCRCWCHGNFHGTAGAGARDWIYQFGKEALKHNGFVPGETVYKEQTKLPL